MKNKRVIGEELLRFVDGEEKTVQIHAIGNYYVNQELKRYRSTVFDKKGGISKVDFDEADFYLSLAKMSIGSEITIEELKDVDNIDWKKFYEEYFTLNKSKKHKLPDTQDSKQDKKSQE